MPVAPRMIDTMTQFPAFPAPMMMVGWGTGIGKEWEGGSISGGLIQKCQTQRFKTVALQISQCTPQQVKTCQQAGLFVIGWDDSSRFTSTDFSDRGFDGFLAQVESPNQLLAALAHLRNGVGLGKPKAIVTTYFGLDDGHGLEHYRELQSLGVSGCYVECYASDGFPHADLTRMLAQGVVYGIPAADLVPICGVYRGELPPVYAGLSARGRSFGCYTAETMSDAQWTAWGGVNLVTQVYYWKLSAGAAMLHEERAMTYSPGDDGLGRMFKWMEGHKDIVRQAGTTTLQHILEAPH